MSNRVSLPAWFEPFTQPARYKAAYGGRGSGKTRSVARWFVLQAAQTPLRILCLREFQNSIRDSSKQTLADEIARLDLGDEFEVMDQEIRGRNGSLFLFRGMRNSTADALKSLEGIDAAWFDEAQVMSQRSLDLLRPTIRKPGSELWFSWNPASERDPVDVFFRQHPPENAVVVQCNYWDNPWFPEELRRDMEEDRRRDPDKYRHVWCGEYELRSETRVFRNWRIEALRVPDDVIWYYGVDFGFAADPSAAVRCCIPKPGVLYVDHEAVEIGCPMERLPSLVGRIPEARDWPITADSARPETIDYLRRNGFPRIRGARKGKGSVEDGVEWLRGFDVVLHPRCVHAEREFTMYSYRTDPQTGDIIPRLEDANNHVIDALRYATEKLHRRPTRRPALVEEADPRPRDYAAPGDFADETGWKVA